jgi:hypothetical protein
MAAAKACADVNRTVLYTRDVSPRAGMCGGVATRCVHAASAPNGRSDGEIGWRSAGMPQGTDPSPIRVANRLDRRWRGGCGIRDAPSSASASRAARARCAPGGAARRGALRARPAGGWTGASSNTRRKQYLIRRTSLHERAHLGRGKTATAAGRRRRAQLAAQVRGARFDLPISSSLLLRRRRE